MHVNEIVGTTPMIEITARCADNAHTIRLKLESHNPTGSVKDRTASGILRAMEREAPLRPGDVVVESTSGNLGLALARLLTAKGCRFIAVVDPNTPARTRRLLAEANAELVVVDEPDGRGGYLLTRLRVVRELCERNPGYRWTDQYGNPANPAAHYTETGPELLRQAPDLDVVYIAVSTGGTLAGISRHLRETAPATRVVAVDAEGSLVTGDRVATRLLSGIGASRRSRFLTADSYDDAVRVSDADSFAVCRMLRADAGLLLGGSSGSVVRACLRDLAGAGPPKAPVCLCADDGRKYLATFYDDSWLARHQLLDVVRRRIREFRDNGISFERGPRGLAS
ncbi:N-(2-amino-2-carboxyethyl)-L-glutamate synthase [Actinosynnema sp. ALI-1.44]